MKTFVTEYRKPDGMYAGEVDAIDWQHAQQIADRNNRGEIVVGELYLKIPAQYCTPEKADEMCRAFAENGTIPDEEAPDAG